MTDVTGEPYDIHEINSRILQKLCNDPRTRPAVTAMIEEVEPQYKGSFRDMDVHRRVDQVEKKIEEDKQERMIEAAKDKLRGQKSRLLEKYDQKQMDEIEQLMERHAIADYDVAAKVYAYDQPEIRPRNAPKPRAGERWELPKIEDFRKDPAKAALSGAYADIDRIMNGQPLA